MHSRTGRILHSCWDQRLSSSTRTTQGELHNLLTAFDAQLGAHSVVWRGLRKQVYLTRQSYFRFLLCIVIKQIARTSTLCDCFPCLAQFKQMLSTIFVKSVQGNSHCTAQRKVSCRANFYEQYSMQKKNLQVTTMHQWCQYFTFNEDTVQNCLSKLIKTKQEEYVCKRVVT